MTRPGILRRRWRSSGLLGLMVCLLLVAVLVATRPGSVNAQEDHLDTRLGESATARAFVVRATNVAVGTAVVNENDRVLRTEHRFVVVELEASVLRQQNALDTALVTRDGHSYHPRSEFISAGPAMTPPGFTRSYTVVFEVPAARVAGARLVVDDVRGFQVHHQTVRVGLGLDSDVELSSAPILVPDADVRVTR